jgi:hypothetical protein
MLPHDTIRRELTRLPPSQIPAQPEFDRLAPLPQQQPMDGVPGKVREPLRDGRRILRLRQATVTIVGLAQVVPHFAQELDDEEEPGGDDGEM